MVYGANNIPAEPLSFIFKWFVSTKFQLVFVCFAINFLQHDISKYLSITKIHCENHRPRLDGRLTFAVAASWACSIYSFYSNNLSPAFVGVVLQTTIIFKFELFAHLVGEEKLHVLLVCGSLIRIRYHHRTHSDSNWAPVHSHNFAAVIE